MAPSTRLCIFSCLLVVSSTVVVVVWVKFDHVSRVIGRRLPGFQAADSAKQLLLATVQALGRASGPSSNTSALAGLEQRPEQLDATATVAQQQQQQQQQQETVEPVQPTRQLLPVSPSRRFVTLQLPLRRPVQGRGSSFDEHLYDTLVANGVSSPQILRSLDPQSKGALQAELRVDGELLERVFVTMYGFRGNFHRKDYTFAVEPPPCPAAFTGTLMFVFTLPKEAADRNRIRSGWAKELLALQRQRQRSAGSGRDDDNDLLQVRVQFIMGRTRDMSINATAAAVVVAEEIRRHGDVLLVDFEEDYYNLTLKSLLMMRWTALHCPTARLLVKVDANVQVVPSNFLLALDRYCLPAHRSFLGWVSSHDVVHRDRSSKWYVPPAVFGGSMFPPFAHGPCYVVTVDMLGDLLSVALSLDYLHLEDVFVSAVCVQRMKDVRLVAIPDFVTWDCSNRRTAAYHDVVC